MHPKVSIIILNWNGLEDTVHCLESIEKITYPNYNIIVVDNGSKGNDAEILREKFEDYIHIIENDKNYGFAEGCNIGMRHALRTSRPYYILLLNNDTTVAPDFLDELVKVAESDPSVGIVGPKIYFYHRPNTIQSQGGRIDWWTGQVLMIGSGETDAGQFDRVTTVDWVSGCALLVKRKTIRDIGLLYPGYFAYFEDTDWCARCTKAGYKVVCVPDAKVWHKKQLDARQWDKHEWYYATRNRFLFMKRNSTAMQFFSFFIRFFFLEAGTPASLFFRRKNLKLVLCYYRGACDGFCSARRKQENELVD